MRYLLATTVLWPLLLYQGIQVRRNIVRLPEARGRRRGELGQGRPLRILVLGDSAAAGVGVDQQQRALSGQLMAQLQDQYQLQWRLIARSGLTTAKMLRYMSKRRAEPFDVVVTSLGVNDVTRGVSRRRWLQQQQTLVALLRDKYQCKQVIVSAMPPLGQFPALPQPLRWTLGQHALSLDSSLKHWLAQQSDCNRIEFSQALRSEVMAADGFHPGAPVYQHWADLVAACIRSRWLIQE
ncbi:Lysophospholipase L1 [Ferrimonas sediminum]|uniref:Lysophospholipase L1 n=1 Tax=Ferrimonas sediminum TaxID=718193 RepID=A0A1G8UM27_9GAMM|nr:SGNH/GDSL hydrolase family protein [Ferrimonas sediminum]SDJ54215.1 Lysophospholipase L1 [Ferrimonas sediminum]